MFNVQKFKVETRRLRQQVVYVIPLSSIIDPRLSDLYSDPRLARLIMS
jgi:hypothetical protein